MKYLHVLLACAAEPWALQQEKLIAIATFLKFKAAGGSFSAEEIQARISKKTATEVAKADGAVALLPVVGVLAQRMSMMQDISGGMSTEELAQQFRAALADNSIKAIVLDFDSPGGTVFGTQEFADEVFASRGIKPIIAQVNSVAASAAYWIASQADEIAVTPGGQAGSIGVYALHEDISKFLEKEGINPTLISAGKFKTIGNEYEPLSAEAKSIIQDRVDQSNAAFVRGVARGRNTSLANINDQFGQGLMFGAAELVKRGMADRVATLSDTLDRFGIHRNPVASKSRANMVAREAVAQTLIQKLSAGDQPTVREWENGFKGLGLTNSEAERAVRVCFKDKAQGEPEKPETDQTAIANALAELRQRIDGFATPKL